MIAIGVLIAKGRADEIADALSMIQAFRPRARLRAEQQLVLENALPQLKDVASVGDK